MNKKFCFSCTHCDVPLRKLDVWILMLVEKLRPGDRNLSH